MPPTTTRFIRWNSVSFYQTIGRLGVPLFLLLTGVLLLQPSKLGESIGEFFRKRWARIGLPFLFWGAAYFIYDFLVVHQINNSPINTGSIIQGVLTGPYYQFWYLYLLVGLYLLTPILRVVMAHAERNLIKYLLTLWLIGAFILPAIYLATNLRLDANVLAFTGYAGYFILGAFLVTVEVRRSLLAVLAAVGIASTMVATYVIAWVVGGVEMFWFQLYFSPTLILAAAALFMLMIKTQHSQTPIAQPASAPMPTTSVQTLVSEPNEQEPTHPSLGRRLLALISASTLGIFLLHPMILDVFQKGYLHFAINGNTLNSIVSVPLNTVLVLFISLGIIVGLQKIPVLKKLVN